MVELDSMVESSGRAVGLHSVRVSGLDVKYRVYEERRNVTMREILRHGIRSRDAIEIHALKSVTFDIPVGQAVGIVGPNGSGKSTLLRAIAGLQPKQGGHVLVRGEPHLLSVTAALKTELSGYRNVILGGLAMGLSLREIEAHLDDVVEFSGLGDALKRPIKTYSAGMRARLGFSIATLRIPDILLIDEALAVGDRDFRTRSLDRINEIREGANTVIMVTHNLNEVRKTCDRAIWLDQGVVIADGDVESVTAAYEQSV